MSHLARRGTVRPRKMCHSRTSSSLAGFWGVAKRCDCGSAGGAGGQRSIRRGGGGEGV